MTSVSKSKKQSAALIAAVAVITVSVLGINAVTWHKSRQSIAGLQTVATSAISTKAVLGAQTQTTPYVVSVQNVRVAQQLEIAIRVTNSSNITQQLSAGLQFKLESLTSGEIRTVTPDKLMQGGPIAAGDSVEGILVFQPFINDQYELRFYPSIDSLDYSVVPLINTK
jgi:hypothetical protein